MKKNLKKMMIFKNIILMEYISMNILLYKFRNVRILNKSLVYICVDFLFL